MARPSFNNPIPRTGMPHFAESSPLRSPRDSDSVPRSHIKHRSSAFNLESMIQAVQQIQRQLARMRIRKGGKSAIESWHFDEKIEVNNEVDYEAQTIIHIQPTHDLVVTGIKDAANPTGDLIKSCAGFWVSTQDVSAKKSVSGNDVWNLPQWPLPNPDNYDDPLNFWIYLGEMTN